MYKTHNSESKVAGIAGETIWNEVERMLASRTFRSAARQREFLRYTVEQTIAGRADLIKEYLIGVEAFGRGDTFDPRLDPIVRTEARKLRARLVKYYAEEGKDDPYRIEFPKGSYVPCFCEAAPPETPPPAPSAPEPAAAQPPELEVFSAPPLPVTISRWRIAAIALAVFALAGSGSAGLDVLRARAGQSTALPEGPSVAVLPFVNLSGGRDEFLSDGMTEELIDTLAQVPGLRVVGRTSAFRFNAKASEIREISQRLHVGTVLAGTVRRTGNRLRVTVQLNSAPEGYHLWAGSFDRESGDALSIESEIARAITDVLETGFPRAGAYSLARKRASPNTSPNPGAHENYLKGLFFWNKLTVESLKQAIEYFEAAIEEDPSFARAYAALADCYAMAPQVAAAPPPEVISTIRAAASKALELESTLGEAHIDLAICAEYEFDWAGAEREFRKGLELSPGNVAGHLWYAKFLALTGRKAEVLAQRRIAAALDPVSPWALQAVAGYLSVTGRYDEAIGQFRAALALDPNFGLAHQGLGIAYLLKGMNGAAIGELQLANRLMDGPRRKALLAYAYAVSGRAAEARLILGDFLDQSRRGAFPALAIAQIYIGLGDKDRAFEWLEKAIDQKDLDTTLLWDSPYQALRSDARFNGLLRRMKLS